MCGTSSTKQTTNKKSKSTTQLKLPSYVNEASKTAVGLAQNQATTPVTPYTSPLVAGLSGDETAAMQALRDYQAPSTTPQALADIAGATAAPNMERIVDESGRLGSIADYFNPYVQQTLNPTLSAIQDAWKEANKRVGMLANAGGGFGDARHGILESENASNAAGQVQDATYKAYYDAWNQAMGGRLSDVNRFTQQDQDYYRRLLEGAKTEMNVGAMDQQQMLQLLRERLSAGATARGVDQAGLTANYGEWLRQQEEEQRRIQQLAQVNATTPYEKTQTTKANETGTTTTTQPDNSGLSLAGSLLSAALAPMTGGASLALSAGAMAPLAMGGTSVGSQGAPAPYSGNPYNLPWLG